MKTFVEDFEYFKKKFTYENLFFNIDSRGEKIIKKIRKVLIYYVISIIVTIVLVILGLYLLAEYKWIILVSFPVLWGISFVFIYIYDSNLRRKFLKQNGFSVPNEFYEWKNKNLETERIKRIYNEYETVNIDVIKKYIEIAKNEFSIDINMKFNTFEKYAIFLGSILINFIISLLLYSYKCNSNATEVIIAFSIIFLILIVILFVYHKLKRSILFNKIEEKEHYKDYIFVLENIIIIKTSKLRNNNF